LKSKSFKIGITGPESSGKTTLAKQLSDYFNALYIPEFARIYLEENGINYTYDDVIRIAQHQIHSIVSANSSIVICDTESLVLHIWLDVKFKKTPDFIIDSIRANLCDIYILCSPDIPWEADEQRENPNDRAFLFDLYVEYLTRFNLKYIVVRGSKEDRLKQSIEFVTTFMDSFV
jgi:NadR type nicotinamide-nucleotide adenylyltransferase